MSTADYAKHAYSVPGGDHDVLLTRLVNEITRTPAGGMGPSPNFADPAAGGIGLSPGALTTSAPGPISEPTPVQSAIPSGAPPDLSAGNVLAGTAPRPGLGSPSVGGAGVSPGAAHALPGFGVPGLAEPQPAVVSSKPADEPLDDLVAQALLGSVYGGPSLGGLGASPGIATTSGAPATGPTRAPYGEVASFHVDPLGLDNPGDGGLQSLLVNEVPRSKAGDGSPASTTAPGSSFYYVENEAPSGAPQSGVPESGKAPIGGSKVDDRATRRLDRKSDRDPKFASAHPPFDINAIRRDFPILSENA